MTKKAKRKSESKTGWESITWEEFWRRTLADKLTVISFFDSGPFLPGRKGNNVDVSEPVQSVHG